MLILGCGSIGCAVARRLVARGAAVTGVARGPARLAAIAASGAQPLGLDLLSDPLEPLICADQALFHFAPPPPEGERDELTARVVAHFARRGHPRRIVYISTTGVYGDCAGAWVDETWPTHPRAARSLRRLDAEQRLQDWAATSGGELVILRVAGIYGPDRLPLERIRAGQPTIVPEQAPWSNRIHADDLVEICLAALDRAPAGAIYNVSDGHPSTMTDYFDRISEAAGLPLPPRIPLTDATTQLSPAMLSYVQESRRLSNRKLLDELGIELRYPTLAAGLAAWRATLGTARE